MSLRNALLITAFAAATLPTTIASAQVCTDFDPPPGGAPWACCGVPFAYDGIGMHTATYRWASGAPFMGGECQPWNACNGAGGHSLWINNVNVDVNIPDFFGTDGVKKITFWYEDFGGNVNLMVNGQLEFAFNDFMMIPANQYAPVNVQFSDASVWTGSSWRGQVTLTAAPGHCIRRLAIGGQELCIDDLCADGPCMPTPPCPEDLDGDGIVGVPDLLMVLAAWGPCAGCPEDLNGDNFVNVADVLQLLAKWGAC